MGLQVIQMTEQRLVEHLTHAARLGAHEALRAAGLPVKEYFTRAELQRRYGRGTINTLISKGKLTPHRFPSTDDNTTKHIVYSETELLRNII